MSLRKQLEGLKLSAGNCPKAGLLDVVILCPLADAGGRPPGVYRTGPPGSSVGVYIYDPAAGEPKVPAERLAPSALLIGGDARPL